MSAEIDFDGLRIGWRPGVLEPRAWTVAQGRWADELLTHAPPGDVLELCAGVGQIGLRAVRDHPGRRLVCVDDSAAACDLAVANARANELHERTRVRRSALTSAVGIAEQFAVVIADPPYLRSAEVHHHPDDPPHAVDGGSGGLDVARECVAVASSCLVAGGHALVQLLDRQQAQALAGLPQALLLDLREVREHERGVVAHFVRHDLERSA